jgi:hypothetical protein
MTGKIVAVKLIVKQRGMEKRDFIHEKKTKSGI